MQRSSIEDRTRLCRAALLLAARVSAIASCSATLLGPNTDALEAMIPTIGSLGATIYWNERSRGINPPALHEYGGSL